MSNNVINLDKDEGYFEYGNRPMTAPDGLEELLQIDVEGINLPAGAEDLDEGDLTTMDFKENGDTAEFYEGGLDENEYEPESSDASCTVKMEKYEDPVKVYLREMGRIPLLSKQQEITLSKKNRGRAPCRPRGYLRNTARTRRNSETPQQGSDRQKEGG